MGQVTAALNRDELVVAAIPVSPAQLGRLLERIADETIFGKNAKALWTGDAGDEDALIESGGLRQITDHAAIAAIVAEIRCRAPRPSSAVSSRQDQTAGLFVG